MIIFTYLCAFFLISVQVFLSVCASMCTNLAVSVELFVSLFGISFGIISFSIFFCVPSDGFAVSLFVYWGMLPQAPALLGASPQAPVTLRGYVSKTVLAWIY